VLFDAADAAGIWRLRLIGSLHESLDVLLADRVFLGWRVLISIVGAH